MSKTARPRYSDTAHRVLAILEDEPATASQVATITGIAYQNVYRTMVTLVGLGMVERREIKARVEGMGRRTQHRYHAIRKLDEVWEAACPRCGSRPGNPCWWGGGSVAAKWPHPARFKVGVRAPSETPKRRAS